MKHYIIRVDAEPEAFKTIINTILDLSEKGGCQLQRWRIEEED